MAKLSPLQDRRRRAMRAAAKRWRAHAGQRSADQQFAGFGEGSADTPLRQRQYGERSLVLRRAAELRRQGRLPIGLERKIGSTLDFLENAPSEAARKAGRPVARIVDECDPKVQAVGFATGFLVGPRLLLTNWHVLPDAGSARGNGANFFHERGEAGVGLGETFELDPDHFFLAHERLDFALVGLKAASTLGGTLADVESIPLTESPGKILVGQNINIIQHPEGGPKTWAVQENRLLSIVEEGFLQYTTDTLGGSSGSPVFSRAWELVGLHHSGIPEMRGDRLVATDGSIWTEEMGDERIHWIANEGVRISALLRSLAETRLDDPRQQAILDALLAGSTDPAEEVRELLRAAGEERLEAKPAQPPRLGAAPCQMTFTGPVTIIVGAAAASEAAEAAAGLERSIRFDPDYADRTGYRPDFLGDGLEVPLPRAAPEREAEMVMLDGREQVLDYHHFSLAMNAGRRLLMWSAANVDYEPARRQVGGRTNFGSDRWIYDPRLPKELQLGDRDFYEPARQADRGHVVRRQDNAWGDTPLEVEYANSDTFHWTNCTPQHAAFNRASPPSRYQVDEGIWGRFETYVQSQLQKGDTRACILAGPVLAPDDPVVDLGHGPVAVPIRFWKVVVVRRPGEGAAALQAYGFLMSQETIVGRFGIEFAPGRFARYRAPLAKIAAAAGILFDPSILAAEQQD